VEGLTSEELSYRVGEANSIAWLVWHLSRIQDDHIADAAQTDQLWTADGWAERFDLPLDRSDVGFGHGTDEVAAVRVESADLLTGYHDAVATTTLGFVRGRTDHDLARVIDESWDPPVTLGVRLVSVVGDAWQHAGQAAFVRGIVQRNRS
ncbi:MAG TPA: DUF664 domain-containing protein, partial [Nocardioidaceae bacterium]|nr:DUF664 domain-containing protein [Nocardioidaceae bacterium]